MMTNQFPIDAGGVVVANAGVTAMFDAAIIIASIRILVAATVTLVLFLFLL